MRSRTSVQIPCRSRDEAKELALRLEADGHRVGRRWGSVIVRTATHEEGEELFRKLRIAVDPGSAHVAGRALIVT